MLYANNMLTNNIHVTYNKIIQTVPWQILFIHFQSNDTNNTLTNSIYVTYSKIPTRASHGLSTSNYINKALTTFSLSCWHLSTVNSLSCWHLSSYRLSFMLLCSCHVKAFSFLKVCVLQGPFSLLCASCCNSLFPQPPSHVSLSNCQISPHHLYIISILIIKQEINLLQFSKAFASKHITTFPPSKQLPEKFLGRNQFGYSYYLFLTHYLPPWN